MPTYYTLDYSCRRKRAYLTRGEARKAKRRMARQQRGEVFKVYQCPFCERWHIAHRRKD